MTFATVGFVPGFLLLIGANYLRLPHLEIPDIYERAKAAWFRDPRHLNRRGAGPFTRQMWAQDEVSEPALEVLRSEG